MKRYDRAVPSPDSSHLDYYDVTWFLFAIAVTELALHAGVAARWLPSTDLTSPSTAVQLAVLVVLILSLAITVRLRGRRSPAAELGWRVTSSWWLAAAVVSGAIVAMVVGLVVQRTYPLVPKIGLGDSIVLAVVLAPLLEESFFRGCLLPVVSRSLGPVAAVVLTSVIFGLFHRPPTIVHLICFTLAGVAYAWMMIASRSTAAAALMHARTTWRC